MIKDRGYRREKGDKEGKRREVEKGKERNVCIMK